MEVVDIYGGGLNVWEVRLNSRRYFEESWRNHLRAGGGEDLHQCQHRVSWIRSDWSRFQAGSSNPRGVELFRQDRKVVCLVSWRVSYKDCNLDWRCSHSVPSLTNQSRQAKDSRNSSWALKSSSTSPVRVKEAYANSSDSFCTNNLSHNSFFSSPPKK